MKKLLITLCLVSSLVFVPTANAQAFDLPEIQIPDLCEIIECPVVTPSAEPSVEPSAVPSVDPTVTPTNTPPSGSDGKGDGRSDGRSDGLCSKPPCVSGNVIPKSPPATGRAI